MSGSCIYCVLTGRGLYNEPIKRPEFSLQNLFVSDGDLEN